MQQLGKKPIPFGDESEGEFHRRRVTHREDAFRIDFPFIDFVWISVIIFE